MVLGSLTFGIAIVAGATITAALNHHTANKKIKKIKEEKSEHWRKICEIDKNIIAFNLIGKKSNELVKSLREGILVFDDEFTKVYKKIYRIRIITKSLKSLKHCFGMNYFTKNDMKEIAYILKVTTNFVKLIDTKVVYNA